MSEKTRTRLTAYIVAEYGNDMLEQIKTGTKIVLFNGKPVEYNNSFRDKRVTESTKVEITEVKIPFEEMVILPVKTDEDIQAVLSHPTPETKDEDTPATCITCDEGKVCPSPGDEHCTLLNKIEETKTKEDNMAVVLKEDGSKRFPTPVGSQYLDETLSRKETRKTGDVIIPDDAKAGEYQGTDKSNKANIEISPVPKLALIPIDQESFDSKLREAKAIIEMNNAGLDLITIASRVRIAESRVAEIIKLGIDEVENQLRRWYEVPKEKSKSEPTPKKVNKPKVTEDNVTEPSVQKLSANNSTEVTTGKARIKGGVKLAEKAIVALLKEKPMTPKDLKAAAIAGVNPSTWVIRISKLKGAGKIVLGADGMYTAV